MKLTPSACPAGTRLIGKRSDFERTLVELVIVEWSSGGLPKVRSVIGHESWMDSVQRGDFVVVEVLK